MFNTTALTTRTNQQSKRVMTTLLSSGVLLLMASSAQAVSNVSTNTAQLKAFENPINYCHSDVEAQTFHPKYQSTRQRAMDCMQTQLRSYQQLSMTKRQQYFAYKAQAWLNYAYHEDSIKSRTLAGTYALREGVTILQALQSGNDKALSLITDIPETSALMRPDLWAILNALKDNAGFESAPRELAFSEVSLIWAAADYCDNGSRQAGPHFRMVDRWLEQAREAYINNHSSESSFALGQLTNQYYKKYQYLDPSDDVCRGQTLPLNMQDTNSVQDTPVLKSTSNSKFLSDTETLTIDITRQVSFAEIVTMPTPTTTYNIAY